MSKLKHSELAAKLAIEGTVAAIAGSVRGQLPVAPKVVGERERADLGFPADGDMLYYSLGDTGVFFYTADASTTIWYAGADCANALSVLDAMIKRAYPNAKQSSDGPHKMERNFGARTYDVKLGGGKMAIVEAIYPMGRVENPKFMVRVVAMALQN